MTPTEHFTAFELSCRDDRIAGDHRAVRNRGTGRLAVPRSLLRLPSRSTLRLAGRRLGGATRA